uniref:Capsid protein n=1 Tax=Tarsiger cyanurus Genomoviridae sp. TaxID=2814994 RepID=A0A8A4XAV8_9VIRU|nr:MAG: capsid protein [Gemycircularvirus]
MRGLSEKLRIQTSSALPWFWRRVVFRLKGNASFQAYTALPAGMGTGSGPFWDGSGGMQRLLLNSNSQTVSQSSTVSAQQAFLFKGASGVDWNDPIIAPIDTSRVSLMYDKTVLLRSGNQSGTITERNMWHGFNKNLVYDDDESGYGEAGAYFSVTSKPGMGDVYVLDQFAGGVGGSASDVISFGSNATLYWHEK